MKPLMIDMGLMKGDILNQAMYLLNVMDRCVSNLSCYVLCEIKIYRLKRSMLGALITGM